MAEGLEMERPTQTGFGKFMVPADKAQEILGWTDREWREDGFAGKVSVGAEEIIRIADRDHRIGVSDQTPREVLDRVITFFEEASPQDGYELKQLISSLVNPIRPNRRVETVPVESA